VAAKVRRHPSSQSWRPVDQCGDSRPPAVRRPRSIGPQLLQAIAPKKLMWGRTHSSVHAAQVHRAAVASSHRTQKLMWGQPPSAVHAAQVHRAAVASSHRTQKAHVGTAALGCPCGPGPSGRSCFKPSHPKSSCGDSRPRLSSGPGPSGRSALDSEPDGLMDIHNAVQMGSLVSSRFRIRLSRTNNPEKGIEQIQTPFRTRLRQRLFSVRVLTLILNKILAAVLLKRKT
jgi:hypothetical protein